MIYLLWVDSFTYLLIGLADFEVVMNVKILLMITVVIFILLYSLSAFITIVIEVPLRVCLKKYIRTKLNKSEYALSNIIFLQK